MLIRYVKFRSYHNTNCSTIPYFIHNIPQYIYTNTKSNLQKMYTNETAVTQWLNTTCMHRKLIHKLYTLHYNITLYNTYILNYTVTLVDATYCQERGIQVDTKVVGEEEEESPTEVPSGIPVLRWIQVL